MTHAMPYWPHSDPQLPTPLCAVETVHVAEPPTGCLNGCHTGHGDARRPTEPDGHATLCRRCIKRLDTWLRIIPDAFRHLLWVKDHGTVPGNPESAHVKAPDAPAPLRLEILDLLDVRPDRGALGLVHGWAELVRDQRHAPRPCAGACTHARASHGTDRRHRGCTVVGCQCPRYQAEKVTVAGECAFIGTQLAWVTGQDWVGDLYAELQPLARALSDAVGDYRPAAIGMCLATVPAPGLDTDVLCGGPLYRDEDGYGVHCARCGDQTDVDTLRRLGLSVGILSDDDTNQQEAS